jgi:hypothetical protein
MDSEYAGAVPSGAVGRCPESVRGQYKKKRPPWRALFEIETD